MNFEKFYRCAIDILQLLRELNPTVITHNLEIRTVQHENLNHLDRYLKKTTHIFAN